MPIFTPSKTTFEIGGREFPKVTWYKEPGMRSLYIWLSLAVLTSATNGYDGSMMNGLQAVDQWKICKRLTRPQRRVLTVWQLSTTPTHPPAAC